VNAWISIHLPFVWRTRLLLYASIAIVASAWFAYASRRMVTTPADTLPLSAVELFANIWTVLTMGFVALVCFDIARRIAPVFATGQSVRLCLCITAAVIAIQLPQLVYFRSLVSGYVRLETASNIKMLWKLHGGYGFWRCLPRPFAVPAGSAEDVRRDLQRYGLRTNLTVREVVAWKWCTDRPDYQSHRGSTFYSLVMWPLEDDDPTASDPRYSAGEYENRFEGRLRSITAAHYAMRGTGPYAAFVDIRRPLAVGALAGFLTTLFVSMPLVRARAVANRGRFTVPLRPRLRVPYDEWIARRWPLLWASRLAVAPLSMLAVPLTFNWIATGTNESTTFLHYSAFALALLSLLGTQRDARYVSGTTRQEASVLIVHAAVLLSMLILTRASIDRGLKGFWNDTGFVYAVAGTIWLCASLQAARIGSIYTAVGALGLVCASVIPIILMGSLGVPIRPAALLTPCASLVVLMLYERKRQVRPTIQRVLLGALFLYTALLWLNPMLEGRDLPTSVIPTNYLAAAVLPCALCSFILILRITENRRRSLAHSPN
jgi:hypothetical protein